MLMKIILLIIFVSILMKNKYIVCLMIFIFMDLPMSELINLAKVAGVMHEADHAYSIWST